MFLKVLLFEFIQLNLNDSLRRLKRMGSYWICTNCTSNLPEIEELDPLAVSLGIVDDDLSRFFFLARENDEEVSDEQLDTLRSTSDKQETILFPVSTEALEFVPVPFAKIKTVPKIVKMAGRV